MDDATHLFLVGAPRCGTTAMAKYLGRHPEISFSKPKEPHFLSRPPREAPAGELYEEYRGRHFARRTTERVLADGSVSYLYSTDALKLALQFDDQARFLMMVRNPISMIHSLHERHLYTMDEDVESFERAWDLQDARMRGEHVPSTCRDANVLQYRHIGQLGAAAKTLFDTVGRERCHIVVFDDFRADPGGTYRAILEFLALEDDGATDFTPVRSNRRIRYRFLQRMLRSPDPRLMKLAGGAETTFTKDGKKKKPWIKRMRNRLIKWNTVVSDRRPLSDAMKQTMVDAFREDIALLSELLDRDLTPWMEGGRLPAHDGSRTPHERAANQAGGA